MNKDEQIKDLKELLLVQHKHAAFMKEQYEEVFSVAFAHHYKVDPKKVELGNQLRDEITKRIKDMNDKYE